MPITTQSQRPSEQSSTRAPRLRPTVSELEHRVASIVRPYSLTVLRVALGVVFMWFGALKVFDVTPVARLVADTVPFLDASWFVPALGVIEVLLGVALIVGRFVTLVSVALVGHLAGRFLVLVTQPDAAFQDGNPLLLTTVGEFVVKNVVLVAAALVLASRLTAHREISADR